MSRFHSSFGQRGQASFEFILVLLFVLTILMVLILPMGQSTQRAMEDVFRASMLSRNMSQLDSALERAQLQGSDSLQPLEWYLPRDSNVLCHIASSPSDVNRISFTVLFSKKVFQASGVTIPGCVDDPNSNFMPCTKSIVFPSSLALRCQQSAVVDFFLNAEEKGFNQSFALRYIAPASTTASASVDFLVR